jgi:hypothetical protein
MAKPAAVTAPLLQQLYDYWDGRRRLRMMPLAADVSIADLDALNDHLLVIDVPRFPPGLAIRFQGEALVGIMGGDLIGRNLEAMRASEFSALLQQAFRSLLATRAPQFVSEDCIHDGRAHHIEALLLPASRGGSSVDLLLCGILIDAAKADSSQALPKVNS